MASEKRVFAITGVLLILAVTSLAQPTPITITPSSGQVFKDIRIVKTNPDGLVYVYDSGAGGGKIKFADLPESTRKRFNYDPAKASGFEKTAQAQQGALRVQQIELRAIRQSAMFIYGTLEQRRPDGIVVSSVRRDGFRRHSPGATLDVQEVIDKIGNGPLDDYENRIYDGLVLLQGWPGSSGVQEGHG